MSQIAVERIVSQIAVERNLLEDFWHKSTFYNKFSPVKFFGTDDNYASFYTAKYLIQDTSEALFSHMSKGFSSDPMQQYIEVWGVFQAIIIQQDAIVELHGAVVGSSPDISVCEKWQELRKLRNKCAGHPVNAGRGTIRSFFGRGQRYYNDFSYEEYNSKSGKTSHPRVNLGELISAYDIEGAKFILAARVCLEEKMKNYIS